MATESEKEDSAMNVYGFVLDTSGKTDMSPFVTKLLTFLRMTKTDYKHVSISEHGLSGSPKGKMPWIVAPNLFDGEPLADSSFIIQKLAQADPAKYELDSHLSTQEKAIGLAMKTMMEESLYFSVLYVRWNTDETTTTTIPLCFRDYHWSIQKVGGWYLRRSIRGELLGQGTGKLSDAEITAKAKGELQGLSDFLGDKKYLMGDKPTSFDATFFAFLLGTLQEGWNHPICQASRNHQNLVDYVERMQTEFWS